MRKAWDCLSVTLMYINIHYVKLYFAASPHSGKLTEANFALNSQVPIWHVRISRSPSPSVATFSCSTPMQYAYCSYKGNVRL